MAGYFGFTGVAAGARRVAKILFVLCLLIALGFIVIAVMLGKAVF